MWLTLREVWNINIKTERDENSTTIINIQCTKQYLYFCREDPRFYSSFPSVIKRPDGELLVAFRRAPDHKIFSEKFTSHVDPNSYLMVVRSRDGETWTKEPDLIYAHPFGGSQDPCLLQLRDGMLLCTSYGWAFVRSTDGGNGDIGYTWPVVLDRNRVLVTYYFNKENGTRHIAGTILEIK